MADLHSIIRLHKHELDEKRRHLHELYTGLQKLEDQKTEHLAKRAAEQQAMQQSDDVAYTYASFLKASQIHEEELNFHIANVEKLIEAAKQEMLEAYSELKKYEMTQEERERLEEEERRLQEGKELDDIGIGSFVRQQQED